ncbi:MAG: DUF4244 domain-containing protein [Quadrisphaera sp.]
MTHPAPAPTSPGTATSPGAVEDALDQRHPGRGRGLGDAGMATAEYAIATLAACGFAALLLAVLSSGEVRGMLLGLVQRALSLV